MKSALDQHAARMIRAAVRGAAAHYHAVLVVVALLTPLFGYYSYANLGVNAELTALFSEKLRYRILDDEFLRAVPALRENLVVVVDAPIPEDAAEAARRLAQRMSESGDELRNVFHPGSPFFERHALLYESPEDLEDLADRLAAAQPYLAALAADSSLAALARTVARGARAAEEEGIDGDRLARMLTEFSTAIEAYEGGGPYRTSWAALLAPATSAGPSRRQLILAQPVLDFSSTLAAEGAVERVRALARDVEDEVPGVRVRLTGDMVLSYEEMSLLERQMVIAGAASFCIVAATMVMAFRSLRLVVVASLNMVVGLIWTMAFATAAIGHLNVISVAFAVLFIGLSDDYGIHFCIRYREWRSRGRSNLDSLTDTAGDAGVSICVCAITTAVGFYAFLPTDFRGVAELGLISGTGMFINVLLSFTFLPALVTLTMSGKRVAPAAPDLPPAHQAFPATRPGLVVAVALVFAAAAAATLPWTRFDANPLRVRDPSAESVQTFLELVRDGEGSPWNVSVLVDPGPSATAVVERLSALAEVESAFTIEDFVPSGQAEKRAILDDVKLFLSPARTIATTRNDVPLERQYAALRDLRSATAALASARPGTDLAVEAHRLAESIGRVLEGEKASGRGRELIEALETSLLSSLEATLASLDAMLRPGLVTRDRLPHALVERMVATDGRLRVEVEPREDLSDDSALDRFVTAVASVTPDVMGGAVHVYESKRAVVTAFRQAFAGAAIAIAILLVLIWRSLGDSLLVMAPLALAALLTTGVVTATDIPFNYANVIVLPLLFGLGVNSGIHLVERWRLTATAADHLLETSTARAVFYSSLNTIGSFGTLGFTTHRGMASMGQMLALGVGLTLACNLVVLPALIVLLARRRPRAGKAPA